MNPPRDTTPLLHNGNGNGSETSLPSLLRTQPPLPDYDLCMENRLAYSKWDQINMNVTKLPSYDAYHLEGPDKAKNGPIPQGDLNGQQYADHIQNGNQNGSEGVGGQRAETSSVHAATSAAGSELSLSRSTEELSPEKRSYLPQVMKSHSISNIEAGGMKLYSLDGDEDGAVMGRMVGVGPGAGAQAQSIVRSKSASQLLNDQPLHVYNSSSTSSSDLLSSSMPPATSGRYPASSSVGAPPPQYNIQYTSSAMPKENMWAQRSPAPPEQQGYFSHPPHSLANTNFSNRNQAPQYPLQLQQQKGPPMAPKGDWTKERLYPAGGQVRSSTLQRQSSGASAASIGEMRRMQPAEGEYMTYRDIHAPPRGPLAMAAQRPFSARTYSIDGHGASRPVSARPLPHELSERTMSVSDFNYQQISPSKRPNARVKSEHSLLDGPGPGRVPADWRDQVMRHIEAKKIEKVKRDQTFCEQITSVCT